MSHGEGYALKDVRRILKNNGYTYDRFNGHYIYKSSTGNTIAIPRSCCRPLIQRVFKENGIRV